jgi:hypothetical protein
LAYAAAGSVFGANAVYQNNSALELSIDDGVRKLVESAKITPRLKQDEATQFLSNNLPLAYLDWARRFAPDSAFRLYDDLLQSRK